ELRRCPDAEGYCAVSVEASAGAAGSPRLAVYRRWSGRAALVLAEIAVRLDVPAPPDTGCTLCDIDEGFGIFLSAYRKLRPEALGAPYAECAPDPEPRGRYTRTLGAPPRPA